MTQPGWVIEAKGFSALPEKGGHFYLANPLADSSDLAADPQETNNLYETSPETVEKLRQVLQMAKIEGVALK